MGKVFVSMIIIFCCLGCQKEGLHFKIKYEEIDGLTVKDRLNFEGNHIGTVTEISHEDAGPSTSLLYGHPMRSHP